MGRDVCAPGASETTFLRRDGRQSRGRVDTVDNSTLFTFVDHDIEEGVPYTVIVNTIAVTTTLDTATPPNVVPAARVVAVIEVGDGNGKTRTVYDATDLLLVPVMGDHVRVSIALEDPLTLPGSTAALAAQPISLPNFASPAPAGARAQVSAFLSKGAKGFAYQPDFFAPVVPVTGAGGGGESNFAANLVVSTSPCRLVGLTAMSPVAVGGGTTFLWLVSNPSGTAFPLNLPGNPKSAIVKAVIPLPPSVVVAFNPPSSIPFDRGFSWALSTTAATFTAGGTARVDAILLRRPIVQLMNKLPSSTGQ